MRIEILAIGLLFCLHAAAQKTLSQSDLVAIIKTYHPVVKQADLDVRIAGAQVTESRGAFDPVITYEKGRKDFEGSTYYDRQWGTLKVPTWYGIDLYAGIEAIEGSRTNAEETKGQINYMGISVPVVQNLLMDKRRAALQQARIFRQATEAERTDIINNLLQEALVTYWDWWQQHRMVQLVTLSLQNAEQRFGMVQTAYRLGDRPAIDTLEALTQVQLLQLKRAEAQMYLQKSRLALSLFLWNEAEGAVELPSDIAPASIPATSDLILDTLLIAARQHPALQVYQFKLNALEIDRRLKMQLLLPQVDLKYNQLGRDLSKTINGAWLQNNYRYGVTMSVPLRLSEGRGAYRQARLKVAQAELSQTYKRIQLENKVRQYFTEWQLTRQQEAQQALLVNNYAALQRAEEIKFQNGESSLFLINTREQKTIEAQQKLLELSAKRQQARVSVEWAAGLLGQ